MGTTVFIQGARLSYPHLTEARAIQPGDTPKFGAAILIPKNNPAVQELLAAAQQEIAVKWPNGAPPTVKPLPLHDGATHPSYSADPNMHQYMILSANSKDQPQFFDQDGNRIMDGSIFYPGCYVNALVGVYTYDMPTSKGAAAGLNGIGFLADGDRLDNRPDMSQYFKPVEGAPPATAPGVMPAQQPAPGYPPAQQPPAQQPPAQQPAPGYPPPNLV